MNGRASATAVFVYGTLRRGAGHPMHRLVADGGCRLGDAWATGTLWIVSWYPGLTLGAGPGRVHGEVWVLPHTSRLAELDAYEGCGVSDPEPHEYARREIDVFGLPHGTKRVWAYEYIGATDGLALVPSGDWLDVVEVR